MLDAIHGIQSDRDQKQTNVIYNCNEPHWENEHFEFPIKGLFTDIILL
jgi:hypothetical protein